VNIIGQKELLISNHRISVSQTRADSGGEDLITPDGQWDIMVYKLRGDVQVLLFDRPLLEPVRVPVIAGQEQLIISFHAGSYMAQIARSDEGAQFLPVKDNKTFELAGTTFALPTLETVENFVEALIERGILVQDKVVAKTAHNRKPGASIRTIQRQFRQVTGMTPYYYAQAERARQAATLLREGKPTITVAYELNYTDQFHMTHALKKFVGKTPRQIQQEEKD
jgi:AraC-like DNA-binding protein